jgi:hypothetical protein
MIGKLELNFVSPELVTDSSMIGCYHSIVDISSIFLSIDLSIRISGYCCTSGKVCSQFEFIFSCLRNFELLPSAFVKHRPQDILFQYSASSPVVVWLCRMGVVNHLKELGSVSTIK